jgi:hypothetical protein
MEGSGRASAQSGLQRSNESIALLLSFLVAVIRVSRDIGAIICRGIRS